MTTQTITDFDVLTGETVTRPATAEEIESFEQVEAANAKEAAIKAKAEAAKEAAQAKLAVLGLTIDDLKALGL